MLKNIRLHIEKDEEKQTQLEKKLATSILAFQKKNENSFARNIPSLLRLIASTKLQNYSLFCNKYGEINVVDYGTGRTLYGFYPRQEVSQQIDWFQQHSPMIDLTESTVLQRKTQPSSDDTLDFKQLTSYKNRTTQPPLPAEIECLVVLGCGLGFHIESLLSQHKIKNLIVYEPQAQYFQCSTMAMDWSAIFEVAKQQGTALFLQIEKDGRNLIDDIEELSQHTPISKFHVFKHYNHPIFDSLFNELTERSWGEIKKNGFTVDTSDNYLTYVPNWTPQIDLQHCSPVVVRQQRFESNLRAFEKFFPAIYQQYKDYKPKHWLPICNDESEINILNIKNLSTWYGKSPKHDCNLNFDNFYSQPNKDGLILGYTGTKLAHYAHYKFVKETEALLKESEEEIGELPASIASIIMFGLGVGYQIERLLRDHSVEKLFICEPNPDFFYASLYAVDWQAIFDKVDKSDARIYLNIGDDGTHLFRDLLSQFHSIGPYILNNTYFYQSYYNSSLNLAIAQLREQLQVVISMGEYFDHAYYGIEHTKEVICRNYPILTHKPSEKLSYDNKEVPIFIVGNGPSLDNSIETIKEFQHTAIIVSCGTALQVMHRHGITPDFHAEIEQNRTTYDWATFIGDLEYLKNISLLSCNGIHPDTCNLYKDVLIAFKEGESSTVSALQVLGEQQFETLKHAFPTVSNFVCDIFSTLGFTSIYLIGVDLGFIDVKHHHSKSSGYYQQDGKETYDYSSRNNTSLVVPGNFRPTVNTKHEFKVSRQIIEQVTNNKPRSQTFYNCSDGAKISGTTPLDLDELLIISGPENKRESLNTLTHAAFSNEKTANFLADYRQQFSIEQLTFELNIFEKTLDTKPGSAAEINYIINKQKEMLFASYQNGKSLLFYYLYGTVNYANALLTKLNSTDFERSRSGVLKAYDAWNYRFKEIKKLILDNHNLFDISSYHKYQREMFRIESVTKHKTLLVVTDSLSFYQTMKNYQWLNSNAGLTSITYACQLDIPELQSKQYDYVIYFFRENENSINPDVNRFESLILGTTSSVYIVNQPVDTVRKIAGTPEGLTLMPVVLYPNTSQSPVIANTFYAAETAVHACFSNHQANMIILKYYVQENTEFCNELPDIECLNENDIVLDFSTNYCVVHVQKPSPANYVSDKGTRGLLIPKPRSRELLVWDKLDADSFLGLKKQHLQSVNIVYDDAVFDQFEIIEKDS